jgi:hypothetical protein
MRFLKFCAVTIHDPCIQLAARLSIFTQIHKKTQYHLFVTGRTPNKMHLCEIKQTNFLFNSDALLTKRGHKHNSKTKNKTLGKS